MKMRAEAIEVDISLGDFLGRGPQTKQEHQHLEDNKRRALSI
jgi:hypothetical protein